MNAQNHVIVHVVIARLFLNRLNINVLLKVINNLKFKFVFVKQIYTFIKQLETEKKLISNFKREFKYKL